MPRYNNPGPFIGQSVPPLSLARNFYFAGQNKARVNPSGTATAGNVTINPGYWNNSIGQAELRQRQQIEAETQLRNLQTAMVNQSQTVQVGSHRLSPEELAQRQHISQDSLSALNSIAPYVQSGMMDADAVRKAVGQVASDSFGEQQRATKANREFQTISEGYSGGRFGLDVASGAMEQMEQKYGEIFMVNHVRGYADAKGLRGQLDQARNEQVQAKSEQYGVPFVWDEKANKPVRDDEAVTSMTVRGQLDIMNQKIANAPRQAALEVLKIKIEAASKNIASRAQQGLDTTPSYKQFDKLINEQFNLVGGQQRQPSAQPASTGGATEEGFAAAVSNTKATPVISHTDPRFNTRAEAAAALPRIPEGKVVWVEGVRRVKVGGKLVRRDS